MALMRKQLEEQLPYSTWRSRVAASLVVIFNLVLAFKGGGARASAAWLFGFVVPWACVSFPDAMSAPVARFWVCQGDRRNRGCGFLAGSCCFCRRFSWQLCGWGLVRRSVRRARKRSGVDGGFTTATNLRMAFPPRAIVLSTLVVVVSLLAGTAVLIIGMPNAFVGAGLAIFCYTQAFYKAVRTWRSRQPTSQ